MYTLKESYISNIKHNVEIIQVKGKGSIFLSLRRKERERAPEGNSLNGYFHIQMFYNHYK